MVFGAALIRSECAKTQYSFHDFTTLHSVGPKEVRDNRIVDRVCNQLWDHCGIHGFELTRILL